MYVAGSHNRLSKSIPQLHNPLIEPDQIFFRLKDRTLSPQHKIIISKRLDLQIIIEVHQPCNLLLLGRAHQGLVKLPCLAGGSHNQALPVFLQHALGNPGTFGIIFQVGPRHHPVQVYPANFVFCKDNHVVSGKLFDSVRIQLSHGIHRIQICHISVFQHFQEFEEDLCRTARIIHRPVMVFQGDVKSLGHRIQLVTVQLGQEYPGKPHRIRHSKVADKALALCIFADKAHIKVRIVGHQNRSPAKFQEPGEHLLHKGLFQHHIVADSCKLLNLKGNGNLGIYKGAEPIRYLSFLHPDCPNLNDPVMFRTETGGLNVKDHIGGAKTLALGIRDNLF